MNLYDDPNLLHAEIKTRLLALTLLVERYDQLTGAQLSDKLDLELEDDAPAVPEFVNGMSAPDENGLVCLEVLETMRAQALQGDSLDRAWATRIGKRWAIQDTLDRRDLTERQRNMVLLNCDRARFFAGIGAGGASLPMGPVYELTEDDIGPRLSGSNAIPDAAAFSSAFTRGAKELTPGVRIGDVKRVLERQRELFRVQNQHVNWD